MFRVELPYDIGTFLKVKNTDGKVEYCGTVAAYTVTDDGWLVWVSGYKQPVTGECFPEQVELMTEEEIDILTGDENSGGWTRKT